MCILWGSCILYSCVSPKESQRELVFILLYDFTAREVHKNNKVKKNCCDCQVCVCVLKAFQRELLTFQVSTEEKGISYQYIVMNALRLALQTVIEQAINIYGHTLIMFVTSEATACFSHHVDVICTI